MNIEKIREDFPILSRTVYGKPLVYFDNGATTQKPRLVIDSIVDEYYSVNANVHRGVHYLSQQATELPPVRRYAGLAMPPEGMRVSLRGGRRKALICLFPALEMSLCRKVMK